MWGREMKAMQPNPIQVLSKNANRLRTKSVMWRIGVDAAAAEAFVETAHKRVDHRSLR